MWKINDFGFMWLTSNKEMPTHIAERFHNILADLNATTIVPPQKKSKKSSSPNLNSGKTPQHKRRGTLRGDKPSKTTEVSLEDLLCMQKTSRTYPKKLRINNHAIHNYEEPLYV